MKNGELLVNLPATPSVRITHPRSFVGRDGETDFQKPRRIPVAFGITRRLPCKNAETTGRKGDFETLFWWHYGDSEEESCPFPQLAFEPDTPPLHLNQMAGDI